jgi:ketosteroid isomerase-like protein
VSLSKTLVWFGLLAATAAAVPATAQPGSAAGAARREILALRAANNRAIAARDLDGVMAIAADDYVLVGGNGGIHRSRAEMRELWARGFADPHDGGCVRTPQRVDAGASGGVLRAAESGRWACPAHTPGGEARYAGRYLAHWSRRSGAWRVVADVYVTLACRGPGCSAA